MLRLLLFLIAFYFIYRVGKLLLRRYINKSLDNYQGNVKRRNDKFKDADDAKFTDIIDPDKKKPEE